MSLVKSRFTGMAVVVLSIWSVAILAASPLDKTPWRVEITPEGETLPHFVDQILFKEGKLVSAIFGRRGFPDTSYTLNEKGGGTSVWEAKQKSDTEGDLAWHGEVEGETLKGTLVWKKADGKVIKYLLAGGPSPEEPAASEETTAPAAKGKKFFGCTLIIPRSVR